MQKRVLTLIVILLHHAMHCMFDPDTQIPDWLLLQQEQNKKRIAQFDVLKKSMHGYFGNTEETGSCLTKFGAFSLEEKSELKEIANSYRILHPCLERKWVHLILSFNLLSTLVAKLIIETQSTKFLSSLVFINFILISLATVDYCNKKRIQEINSMLDKNAYFCDIHFS